MAFSLAVANTVYATEDGLSWLALEDSSDLLTDALSSLYATEDGLSWFLTESGLDISTETDLGLSTDLTPYLAYGGVTLKLNTLDFTLIDPPPDATPLTAAVTTTDPSWSGNVASVTSVDPVDRSGHTFYAVTATNTKALPSDTAPFNLSDVPVDTTFRYLLEDGSGYIAEEAGTDFGPGVLRLEGALAYAYSRLNVRKTLNSSGPDTNLGRCTVYQAGLRPGNTFKLTSANQAYSAMAFQINQTTVIWQGVPPQPAYAVEFGDTPQTLALWTQVNAPVPIPVAAPPVSIPAGPVIYGNATAAATTWPMGGGVVSIATATFSVSAPAGHSMTCQVLGAIDCRAYGWDNYVPTPRRGVRATLSGAVYVGAWQETPLGTSTSAGARATYDLSSAAGISLPNGTYTVTIDINTVEYNQIQVYGGWVQVSVITI